MGEFAMSTLDMILTEISVFKTVEKRKIEINHDLQTRL